MVRILLATLFLFGCRHTEKPPLQWTHKIYLPFYEKGGCYFMSSDADMIPCNDENRMKGMYLSELYGLQEIKAGIVRCNGW